MVKSNATPGTQTQVCNQAMIFAAGSDPGSVTSA